MGDFINVLTTIAACSASIVAILGGLIASRLISLNAERDEVSTRLFEIDEEIAFNEKQRLEDQTALDEDDALDFIRDNIALLVERQPLASVYERANRQPMDLEALTPYWNKAISLLHLIYSDMQEHGSDEDYPENDDKIPLSVVEQLNGDFEYDVCREIEDYFEKQSRANSPLSAMLSYTPPITNGLWYSKTKDKVAASRAKIEWLTIQKGQLEARCNAVRKPRGMKSGMVLFATFSAINIALPLGLLAFWPPCFVFPLWGKVCIIGAFVLGMALILFYLAYLLKWKGPK